MKPLAAVLLGLAIAGAGECLAATGEKIELVPAVMVTGEEKAELEQTHQTLLSNQDLIVRVLKHLKLEFYKPEVPAYKVLGANSLLGLINQTYYADIAAKLGVKLPQARMEGHGSGLKANYRLHRYNNDILRAVALKLALKVPDQPPETESVIGDLSKVIAQNHQILSAIATKLGVAEK